MSDLDNEYVISIKIKTDKQLLYREIPKIVKECIENSSAEIVSAETYESWKEEQDNK